MEMRKLKRNETIYFYVLGLSIFTVLILIEMSMTTIALLAVKDQREIIKILYDYCKIEYELVALQSLR